jgi:DNA-binding transcriptional LysR family regulator
MLISMSVSAGFDLDLLRSFVILAEEKSFTRAAARVGRTQSAVSLQMQRLEDFVGHPLLQRRRGGTVDLSSEGQYLLGRAAELLGLNDEILHALVTAPTSSRIRLGLAEEFSVLFLSAILEHFAVTSPTVEVQVIVAPSCALSLQLRNHELDLAVLAAGMEPQHWQAVEIWRSRLCWITSCTHDQHRQDPLPLSISPSDCPWRPPWLADCVWRSAVLKALDRCGRSFRVHASSGSTVAQLGAVIAGLAVTAALADSPVPDGLRIVGMEEGLPALPEMAYLMVKAHDIEQPLTDLLASQIITMFSALPQSV